MLRNSDAVHGGFAAIVGSIYERGVEEAVPWLIAMVCVVVVDLFAGVFAVIVGTCSAFKSNIAAMVDYITAQNPACKIGFLTLIHRLSAWDGTAEVPNAAGAVLSDYCTAIKEVAMTYGLPVLDLWNECQCNFNFSIYKTNYSSHESEASGDGLHPTNEAHKLFLYPLVREFVKKLL